MPACGRRGKQALPQPIPRSDGLSIGMARVLIAASVAAPALLVAATVAESAPRATDVVPCSVAIRQSQRLTDVNGLRLVLDRIWLPRRTLQLGRAARGWDRFAKVGIVVRAGPPVVLEVPSRWRGVYSLEYAPKHVQRLADGSTRLSVHACAGALGNWSAYAGGYVVTRPQCVPLIVRANGRMTRVHVAIGRPCTAA
jgi:hypothetical protein